MTNTPSPLILKQQFYPENKIYSSAWALCAPSHLTALNPSHLISILMSWTALTCWNAAIVLEKPEMLKSWLLIISRNMAQPSSNAFTAFTHQNLKWTLSFIKTPFISQFLKTSLSVATLLLIQEIRQNPDKSLKNCPDCTRTNLSNRRNVIVRPTREGVVSTNTEATCNKQLQLLSPWAW